MYTDEYLKLYGKLVEVNRQIKEADIRFPKVVSKE